MSEGAAKKSARAPKRVPAKTKRTPEDVLRLVNAAQSAAHILRSISFYQPASAAFDQVKVSRLRALFQSGNLPDEAVDDLIGRAQEAVLDLHVAREQKPGEVTAKLQRFANAAQKMSEAWSCLDHDLTRILQWHMEGRFPTARHNLPASAISALNDRSKRIEKVLDEDIWSIASGAADLARTLEASSAHRPHEYLCAWKIAQAWEDCTGSDPTETHESTSKPTPFQLFVRDAVAPMKLGSGVISSTIQAFKARKNSS